MTLSSYRNTAAEIAAAAIYELFPEIELLGGRETHEGFSYDLDFPHVINEETLPTIEQKMREIVRERREITVMEMVPFSARELLKAKGHQSRAEQIPDEGLVQVIQIGSFFDLASGHQLKNSNQLVAFKLDRLTELDDGSFRLTGFASHTKDDLKEFLKRLKEYSQRRHGQLGEAQGLWKIDGEKILWLQKGLKTRERLLRFFEKNILQGIEQISADEAVDRFTLSKRLHKPIAEVAWTPNTGWDPEIGLLGIRGFQIKIFSPEATSLLQSIEKSLNILGLKYKKEFCVEDLLGREWPVVEIRRVAEGTIFSLSIEKMVALILERDMSTGAIDV